MTTQSQISREDRRETKLFELAAFDRKQGPWGTVIGIDEVGVGSWAGPLVACALILKSHRGLLGVDDCKKLKPEQRKVAYQTLLPQVLESQVIFISPEEVDRLTVYQAAKLAREKAFYSLRARFKAKVVLVDGDVDPKFKGIKCRAIPKADGLSLSVAAASIVAKAIRDRYMAELGVAYPEYGWARNSGYGTKGHMAAIKLYGITPYHRLSFDPIRTAAKLERREKTGVFSLRRAAAAHERK